MQHSFHLKQMLNKINEGVLIINKLGHIIFSNSAASEKMDLANKKHINEVWPHSRLITILETGNIEMDKLLSKDGFPLFICSAPIYDYGDQIIGALFLLLPASDANDCYQMELLLQVDLQNIAEGRASFQEKLLPLFEAKTTSFFHPLEGKWTGNIRLIPKYEKVMLAAKQIVDRHYFQEATDANYTFKDIVVQSDSMKVPYQQAMLASMVETPVLIRGKLGTGKKMFASAIHHESSQKCHLFRGISCTKITENLLAQFLSFPNDGDTNKEVFQGTLYLEEIDRLPLLLQKKLLAFLGAKNNNFIRIIAGSSENLEKQMVKGQFIEALYYELNKFCIHLPSLHERLEDLPLLIESFINECNDAYGRYVEEVDAEVFQMFQKQTFHANTKELKAVIQLAMVSLPKEERKLEKKHFSFQYKPTENEEVLPEIEESAPLSLLVEKYEKVIIGNTLKKHEGNKTLTAKALGLSVRNLYYKLEKYGLM